MDVPNSFNSIIFASARPTQLADLVKNYQYLKDSPGTAPILLQTMAVTLSNLQPDPPSGEIFTDDRAPIEWITNNMVLSFLFNEKVENIQ
jgi:hypothetical protein